MSLHERLSRLVLALTAVLGVVTMLAIAASLTFGLRPVIIQSGSMEPTIGTGALLVTHPVEAESVRVGDVVTVPLAAGGRVTHRVIAERSLGDGRVELRLQGDANPIPDELPVVVRSVDASSFHLPVIGGVIAWFSGSPGILVAAGLVALLVSVAIRRDEEEVLAASKSGSARTFRYRPVGLRCSRRRAVVRLTILLFALGITPAAAAWNDTATAKGTTLATTTIKPAEGSACVIDNTPNRTITTYWLPTTVPNVTYTAKVREATSTAVTVAFANGQWSAFLRYSNLPAAGTFSPVDYHIDITATRASSSWTAVSTRTIHVPYGGYGMSCLEWT